MRFSKLVVIDRAEHDAQAHWRCRCDCGTEKVVGSSHLRNGNTTSCGCHRRRERPDRRIDVAGQRFGRLIALAPELRTKPGNTWWLCMCDCGKQKRVRLDRLKEGLTISCGCAVAGPFVATRSPSVRMDAATRHRVLDGRVTPAEIDALYTKQKGRCPNCGADLEGGYHRDHVIPISRGGLNVIANIQLLCVPCNRRKYNKMPWEFALEQGRLV